MEQQEEEEHWSIEKVLVCLKRIVHKDVLPHCSTEELNQFEYRKMFRGTEKVHNFLTFLYEKSNKKLEIYGTVDEMIENLRKVDKTPEFIKYSLITRGRISSESVLLTSQTGYSVDKKTPAYSSKSDIAITIYKSVTEICECYGITYLAMNIFSTWHITYLNFLLQRLQGYHEFLPSSCRQYFINEISVFVNTKRIFTPLKDVTFESFCELKKYFPKNDRGLINLLTPYKSKMADARNQIFFNSTYSDVLYLLANIHSIYKNNDNLFIPFVKARPVVPIDRPVIRLFENKAFEFYLSQEIIISMKPMIRKRFPINPLNDEKMKLLKDNVAVESYEERKLGIVYTIKRSDVRNLLNLLELDMRSFVILRIEMEEDYQTLSLPIISSYGTHCIPALDAFCRIFYHLTIILQVFDRYPNHEIFDWIYSIVEKSFVVKNVFYFIEISKIDELIKQSEDKFPIIFTGPDDCKTENMKTELQKYVRMYGQNTEETGHSFTDASSIIKIMSRDQITIKDIYNGFAKMFLHSIEKNHPMIAKLIECQSKHFELNRNVVSDPKLAEVDLNEIVKLPLDKFAKEQEPENMPSCSTQNVFQQHDEELETLRRDKNSLELQLQLERSYMSTEIQLFQEEMERYRASEAEIRTQLSSHFNRVVEYLQSTRKELEASKSENEKLRAAHLKTTEFQQKVEELSKDANCDSCSRLHRLCSDYLESDNIEEDAMVVEESVENSEKEHEQPEE